MEERTMKLLFENWRKYIIEVDTDNDGIDDEKELAVIDKGELPAETDQPDFEDLKKVIREEIQNGLMRSSRGDGFKPEAVLWSTAHAVTKTGTILVGNIEKRFREEFPDQIIDKGYTLDIKGGRFSEFHLLMREVGEEVFELYDLIKALDEETKTKIWNMVYTAYGVGWLQALEILRTLQ
jgi:hypothetical protein